MMGQDDEDEDCGDSQRGQSSMETVDEEEEVVAEPVPGSRRKRKRADENTAPAGRTSRKVKKGTTAGRGAGGGRKTLKGGRGSGRS